MSEITKFRSLLIEFKRVPVRPISMPSQFTKWRLNRLKIFLRIYKIIKMVPFWKISQRKATSYLK